MPSPKKSLPPNDSGLPTMQEHADAVHPPQLGPNATKIYDKFGNLVGGYNRKTQTGSTPPPAGAPAKTSPLGALRAINKNINRGKK